MNPKFLLDNTLFQKEKSCIEFFGKPKKISKPRKGFVILDYSGLELTFFRGLIYLIKIPTSQVNYFEMDIEQFLSRYGARINKVEEIDSEQMNLILDSGITAIFDKDKLIYLYRKF